MAVSNIDEGAVRIGSCKQCGQCCMRLGWLLIHADENTVEWIRARASEIVIEPDADVQGYYHISLPYPCQHLKDIGDGKYSCDMHEDKPLLCKQYPSPTDDLKPGCGFSFSRPQ